MDEKVESLDLNKMKRTVTWKFRGFLAGLTLSVGAISIGLGLVHPGLFIAVWGAAAMFFCHVNAKLLDDTLLRIRQAEMLMSVPKAEAKDLLRPDKNYTPGGYH